MKNDTLVTQTTIEIGNHEAPVIYVTPRNEKLIAKALERFLKKMYDTPCLYYYVSLKNVPCVIESIHLVGSAIWASIRYPKGLEHFEREDFLSYLNKGRLYLEGDLEYDPMITVDSNNFTYNSLQMDTLCRSDQLSNIEFTKLVHLDSSGTLRHTIYRIPIDE